MGWVRIDDQAPRHEKLLKAGPAAAWLWVCGLAHCHAQLTNGVILGSVLPLIGIPKGRRLGRLIGKLVAVGLWEKVEGGYRVHDYLNYNQSKEIALANLKAAAARKARWRASQERVKNGVRTTPHHTTTNKKSGGRRSLYDKNDQTNAEQLEKLKAWNDAHPEAGGKADADSPRRRDH